MKTVKIPPFYKDEVDIYEEEEVKNMSSKDLVISFRKAIRRLNYDLAVIENPGPCFPDRRNEKYHPYWEQDIEMLQNEILRRLNEAEQIKAYEYFDFSEKENAYE